MAYCKSQMSLFSSHVDVLSLSESRAEHWLYSLPAPGSLCTQGFSLIMAPEEA